MPSLTFHRAEKLKSRKLIGQLFRSGSSLNAFPLRLVWMPADLSTSEYKIQFTHSVPRRAFPKAVTRNRIGRKIREAYRLHKHLLYEHLTLEERQFAFMVIYVAKQPLPYDRIAAATLKMIKKWKNGQISL